VIINCLKFVILCDFVPAGQYFIRLQGANENTTVEVVKAN